MRFLFMLPLLSAALTALAQPGDLDQRFTNPCGLPPNDSVDVTGDGVPDLLIGGWSMGTDDVPSSTGSCTRFVGTLHGTTLLCGLDRTGQRVPFAFAAGDTIPSLDSRIQNDFEIPRFVFTESAITVLSWGYGHHDPAVVPLPGLGKQVYVFQTTAPYEHRVGTFTVEHQAGHREVNIKVGALVHSDELLIAH